MEGDKIKDEKSKAAFSETRTRGVDGFDGNRIKCTCRLDSLK